MKYWKNLYTASFKKYFVNGVNCDVLILAIYAAEIFLNANRKFKIVFRYLY